MGDAGNSLNAAQVITGGSYDGIAGSIDDSVDVFAFHWIGGDFVAKFFSGADPAIALYDFSQNLLGSVSGLAPILAINNVAAGNYLFEISALTGSAPGYVVGISSPTHLGRLAVSAPAVVPEPATFALMILGVAGLVVVRFFRHGDSKLFRILDIGYQGHALTVAVAHKNPGSALGARKMPRTVKYNRPGACPAVSPVLLLSQES